jgi:hypothetical protein
MGAGTLTIEFDEAVDVQTVKAQQFTIQDGNSPALSAPYPLTGTKTDYTGVDASNSFELEFTDTDLNALKRLNKLAVNALSSQLLILPAALSDMAVPANPLASVVVTPSRHSADLISPNLLAFVVDMDAFTITLNFDETVDASTLEPSAFTVLASDTDPTGYPLTEGSTVSGNGLQVVLSITETDMNAIKKIEGLYRSPDTAWLTLATTAIEYMN